MKELKKDTKYIYAESFNGNSKTGNSITLARHLAKELNYELIIGYNGVTKEEYLNRKYNDIKEIINNATIVTINLM